MDKAEKARILLKEAEDDLLHGNYNKAVSAAYFAVRLTVEHRVRGLRTTKDDKIANALKRTLEVRVGRERAEGARRDYLDLFVRRKTADHRPYSFSREEAEDALEKASRLIRLVEESLPD